MGTVHPFTRRALAFAVSIAIVVAVTQVLLMKPAHADFSWCSSARVCIAEHTYGNGSRTSMSSPVGSCVNFSSFWNDKVSSVRNTFTSSGGYVTFFWSAGCDGSRQSYGPGALVNDVGWFNNDEWSSWCIGPISGGGSLGCDKYF